MLRRVNLTPFAAKCLDVALACSAVAEADLDAILATTQAIMTRDGKTSDANGDLAAVAEAIQYQVHGGLEARAELFTYPGDPSPDGTRAGAERAQAILDIVRKQAHGGQDHVYDSDCPGCQADGPSDAYLREHAADYRAEELRATKEG